MTITSDAAAASGESLAVDNGNYALLESSSPGGGWNVLDLTPTPVAVAAAAAAATAAAVSVPSNHQVRMPPRVSLDLGDLCEEHTSISLAARHTAYYRRLIRFYGFEEITSSFADLDRVDNISYKVSSLNTKDFKVDVHLGGKLSEYLGLIEIAAMRPFGGLFLPTNVTSIDVVGIMFVDLNNVKMSCLSRQVELVGGVQHHHHLHDVIGLIDATTTSGWRKVNWPWVNTDAHERVQLGLDHSGLLWLLEQLSSQHFLVRRVGPSIPGSNGYAPSVTFESDNGGITLVMNERPLKKCRLHSDCLLPSNVIAQTSVFHSSKYYNQYSIQSNNQDRPIPATAAAASSSSSSSSSSSPPASEDDDITGRCISCLDQRSEMIPNGCDHVCLCQGCCVKWMSVAVGKPLCPCCRVPFDSVRRLSNLKF